MIHRAYCRWWALNYYRKVYAARLKAVSAALPSLAELERRRTWRETGPTLLDPGGYGMARGGQGLDHHSTTIRGRAELPLTSKQWRNG